MTRPALSIAATIFVGAIVARTGASPRGSEASAPPLLSQTGLYVAETTVDPRNRAYSPQYPLWTDGAVKSRWIRLPDGAAIDARDADAWQFPVGTKFWKEFAFDGRRVETRFLWRARVDRWVFATYVWNEAQTDATLAPAAGIRAIELGNGQRHAIPSREDCAACHESGRILGFTALQLSPARDRLAPHAEPFTPGMVTLDLLLRERELQPVRTEWLTTPPTIRAATPQARAALGYLTANCGICHREGAAIDTSLRLAVGADGDPSAVLAALQSATSWEIPGHANETRFVTPGRPEHSSIVARMRSRRPSTQMPPLGTAKVDREALALVSAWIAGQATAAGGSD